jgi:pilus assembly protein CpaE
MISAAVPIPLNQAERAAPLDLVPRAPAGRLPLLAFVTDAPTEMAVSDGAATLGIAPFRVIRGGIDKAIQHLSAERSPGILVVDVSGCDFPVSRVFDLADVCEPAVTVIAIGDSNDVALYRQLIQAGVTEYIFKPVTPQLLARAVSERPERATAISRKAGKLVACIGARGGVGTTAIATGLAWHLANRQNRRVALADLDLTHGNCALALNLKTTPGWREALVNPMRVDSVFLERVAAKQGERLAVLSCEESLRDDFTMTEDAVQTSLSVLLGQHHSVIVDVPRVAAAPYRWVLDNADFRIIVADQTLQSARDATRLRAALPEDIDHRNLLVINRGGEAGRRAVPLKEMEGVLGLRPSLVISYEPAAFAKAANAGTPPAAGRGRFPNGIAALAATLSGREAKRRGWWGRR